MIYFRVRCPKRICCYFAQLSSFLPHLLCTYGYLVLRNKNMLCYVIQYNFQGQLGNVWRNALTIYQTRGNILYYAQFVWRFLRGDKMCRERLHILSSSGDNMCRMWQNVPLRVHILSPATNCAGATKCAVTLLHLQKHLAKQLCKVFSIQHLNNNCQFDTDLQKLTKHVLDI